MQVRTAVEDYLRAKYSLAFKTKLSYTQHLGKFTDWCEKQCITLGDVKPKIVDQFASELASLSARTRFTYVRVIKTFLAWCRDEEDYEAFVSDKTVRRTKLPKVGNKMIVAFTADEVQALLKACSRKEDAGLRARDTAMFSLLIDCGLRLSEVAYDSKRPGEVTGLRMDRVFLTPKDPHIRVTGKGSKERSVGLGKKSVRALKQYIEDFRGESASPYVFLSRRGDPLSTSHLDHIVRSLGAQTGIKGCHPHRLRHSFAVMHLKLTGNIYNLSRLMGHSRIDVTENYLRSIEDEQARQGPSVLDMLQ